MSSLATTTPDAPKNERELRRLLVSNKPEDAARLRAWIDADPDDAATRLAEIAQNMVPVSARLIVAVAFALVPLCVVGVLFEPSVFQMVHRS